MSQKDIQNFINATGANQAQAKQFIEIAGGNLDEAVMMFLESGEQPQPEPKVTHQPPQILKPQPQPQPQPPQTKPKPGLFGVKPAKEPVQPVNHVQQPVPVKPQPQPQPVYTAQPPKTQQPQPQYQQPTQPIKREVVEQVQPKPDYSRVNPSLKSFNVKIDVYQNGFVMNNKFFDFNDGKNKVHFANMKNNQEMPIELFQQFPEEERPQPGQEIKAAVDQHQTDYQPSKASETLVHTFNGAARTLGAPSSSQPVVQKVKVNTAFTIPGTKDNVMVKVRADNTFTVKCNKNHTINDLIQHIQLNGGMPGIQKTQIAVKLVDRPDFNPAMSVEKAQIIMKNVIMYQKVK